MNFNVNANVNANLNLNELANQVISGAISIERWYENVINGGWHLLEKLGDETTFSTYAFDKPTRLSIMSADPGDHYVKVQIIAFANPNAEEEIGCGGTPNKDDPQIVTIERKWWGGLIRVRNSRADRNTPVLVRTY